MKRLLRLFLTCYLLAQSIGCAGQADRNWDVDQRGAAAAAATSDAVCFPAASNQYAPFLAAKIKISQRKYRESLGEIDGITTNTPEEEALKLILLGQCYEGLRDTERAFAVYKKARSVTPLVPATILREAILRYRRGQSDDARALLHRYIELESGNPEAFYYLFFCESDADKKAMFARRIILLDGSDGFWSRSLLKATAPEKEGGGRGQN